MDANNFVEFIPILHILICFRYRASILFQTLDDLVRNLNSPNQSEWVLIALSIISNLIKIVRNHYKCSKIRFKNEQIYRTLV